MGDAKTLRRYDSVISRILPALMLRGWECHKGSEPKSGDMVILTSAPATEWSLSFYRERIGHDEHLLESVRTGELCKWHNVGFMVIDPEKASVPREAYWTDDQFAFNDKFRKAWKRGGFYMAVPYIASFDGDLARLAFRTRYGIDDNITPLAIDGWKKITIKALLSAMVAAEKEHQSKKPKKEQRHD